MFKVKARRRGSVRLVGQIHAAPQRVRQNRLARHA
jgi:hypothetical protein